VVVLFIIDPIQATRNPANFVNAIIRGTEEDALKLLKMYDGEEPLYLMKGSGTYLIHDAAKQGRDKVCGGTRQEGGVGEWMGKYEGKA
jgi:hypothetical protein